MGILIDTDLLVENYDLESATKYGNKIAQQQEHSYGTMMMYEIADMIDEQPTAYDVEAVIKELKEYMDENKHETNSGFIEVCIDIVRRGGVK